MHMDMCGIGMNVYIYECVSHDEWFYFELKTSECCQFDGTE